MLECKQIDMAFIRAEQAVTEGMDKKRSSARNAYYGKIPDGEPFPLESGTRIKSQRLGRVHISDPTGWRPVEDELCTTNACDFDPDVITHGNSEYFFSLVAKDLRTDWLCLESLALRPDAAEQVRHFEQGIQNVSRLVHDEVRRSRYLFFCDNKMVATVPRGDDGFATEKYYSCDNTSQINNGWVFEIRGSGAMAGEMDENHVRVCVDPTPNDDSDIGDIDLISELTLDMMDQSRAELAYEDDSYLPGTSLLDVLLPEITMARRMALQVDEDMNFAMSQSGYNANDLAQAYGVERVLNNYALRADHYAMRFYPDTDFNTALVEGDGYAFDENDPTTWPRFERVHPYIAVKSQISGVEFVRNNAYMKAPFGIATIRSPRVMKVMSFPATGGVGSATTPEGFGYAGVARWKNPDWPCNVKRNKGFWMLTFRVAAKPQFTEEGYAWFIRISRRMRVQGNPCALPTRPCVQEVTPYCFEGMGGEDTEDTGFGFNAAIDD